MGADERHGDKAAPSETMLRQTGVPPWAKAYLAVVILLGLAGLVLSGLQVLSESMTGWWGLAALAALSSAFAIRIPMPGKVGGLAFTVSDCFVFISMLVYGPAAAAITAAIDGLVTSVRCRLKRPERFAFNITSVALAAYAVGHLFNLLTGFGSSAKAWLSPRILAGLGVAALVYFLSNALLLAVGITLATGPSFSRVWSGNFAWAAPGTVANMLAALFFTLGLDQPTPGASAALFALAAFSFSASVANLLRGHRCFLDEPPGGQAHSVQEPQTVR